MGMSDVDGTVSGRTEGAVGWVVFDNQPRLNALSSEMAGQALEIVAGYESDPAIRAVVLRGAGEKAFMSGGDISKFKETRFDPATAASSRTNSAALRARLVAMNKPVVAMIHGYCLGGGMGLALCADIRFGDDRCQLGIPAALRGIAYQPEGLKMLMDLVGPSIAKDMMYSGRRLKADEALRVGLLNRVFAPADLEAETRAYVDLVAGNAPLSIRASKYCINQLGLEERSRDQATMQRMQDDAAGSEDFRQATIAFMEKRKPVFKGT